MQYARNIQETEIIDIIINKKAPPEVLFCLSILAFGGVIKDAEITFVSRQSDASIYHRLIDSTTRLIHMDTIGIAALATNLKYLAEIMANFLLFNI